MDFTWFGISFDSTLCDRPWIFAFYITHGIHHLILVWDLLPLAQLHCRRTQEIKLSNYSRCNLFSRNNYCISKHGVIPHWGEFRFEGYLLSPWFRLCNKIITQLVLNYWITQPVILLSLLYPTLLQCFSPSIFSSHFLLLGNSFLWQKRMSGWLSSISGLYAATSAWGHGLTGDAQYYGVCIWVCMLHYSF